MKIFSSFALVLLCLSFFACQKKSDPPSNTSNITASAWVYESGGIDDNKDGSINYSFPPGSLEACRLDNTLKFESNGTGITDEGATKCNTTDPQRVPFNWTFTDSETTLSISGNIYPLLNGRFKVLTVNDTKLTLSKDTVFFSQNVAVIVNLKH